MKKNFSILLMIIFVIMLISNCSYNSSPMDEKHPEINDSLELDSDPDGFDRLKSSFDYSSYVFNSIKIMRKRQADNGKYSTVYKKAADGENVSIYTDNKIYIKDSKGIITKIEQFNFWVLTEPSCGVKINDRYKNFTFLYNVYNSAKVTAYYKVLPGYKFVINFKTELPTGGPGDSSKTYPRVYNESVVPVSAVPSISVRDMNGIVRVKYKFYKWTLTEGSAQIENPYNCNTIVKKFNAKTSIRADYVVDMSSVR